ncbi:Hypothetical protein R9X50_00099900 [Acrodontium crateriforme]|uniref:RING-type domain-containing protein n=1 Tax=Acrodontium crateriforme TaxID=150365 RepID=A0AAQ3R9N6_9PEZI|nr:Hypothetical protein R9X50_00099900 [Acrodontium crateriforme]
MSGYDVEHNIPSNTSAEPPRRRPDLSTFFSTLDLVDTSGTRRPQNEHSLPLPRDVSAAYRNLANAFEMMQGRAAGANGASVDESGHNALLETLVQSLMEGADHPPTEVEGVSDEFLQELERIPKKNLKSDMSCPICSNPFLEDPHPLVVRLPCHKDHLFDLECIQPWLKLNPTCPLDRKMLIKKKAEPVPVQDDEEEGGYDDMYA